MSLAKHINGAQHIGVPTNDLAATVRFFESLGFTVALRAGSIEEPVAFLSLKDVMVETYQNGQALGKPGAIDHIALDVDDVEAAYQEAEALGYPALEGSVQALPFWERGVRFFTISGPNGEKVEFSQKL